MDTQPNISCDCFTEFYNEYRDSIQAYIACRIPHKYDAEDLTQDVFIRLLDYRQLINRDTVKSFLYTIARNIITDLLRRYYKKEEITSYIYDTVCTSTNETEDGIITKELFSLLKTRISQLPPQRQQVYKMKYDQFLSSEEIACRMQLSKKTVENHLQLARKDVKDYVTSMLKVG
ncbi:MULTISPECIES: sigma-70 family RNA polymerase sigma factor [Bacteroides]|uniref:sigma-70 family RNA polymerase sigma factor n=1 Tax=Bacteroides TaxID=816 RepID=UPI00319E458E